MGAEESGPGTNGGLVDTHCHLDAIDFVSDLDAVLRRARSAGVRWFVTIGSGRGTESAPDAVALAHMHGDVVACVGIHPVDARCATENVRATVESLASDARVVGIGETGLDFRSAYADKKAQREAFRWQIALARRVKKPLVVHTRAASAETLDILRGEGAGEVGGVLHSFTDDEELAFSALDLGFDISLSAMLLLHELPWLRRVARAVPSDRLMIESNAPVLAPPPHESERCEPAHLALVAEGLAATLGKDAGELRATTSANAAKRFGLPLA
jgi:TatD DNase family protein